MTAVPIDAQAPIPDPPPAPAAAPARDGELAGPINDRSLDESLGAAAAAPILLVASDFDGTLSDIAPRPDLAVPDERGVAALAAIAAERRTHAAIVSGRVREQLVNLTRPWPGLLLCGSHGAEPDPASGLEWPGRTEPEPAIARRFDEIAAGAPGAAVERKPFGVALHYRGCEPLIGSGVRAAAIAAAADATGSVLDGDKVVEVVAPSVSKGQCVRLLRRRFSAAAVVFIGDDTTDETVFVALKPPDVGVSIGARETSARFRTPDRSRVGAILERLLELRRAALRRSAGPVISSHSLLSDQRGAALVDPAGRISWLCVPRIDSPAIFASLLDSGGGEFGIGPAQAREGEGTRQEYVGDSFVLRTHWDGLTVTDYFDCTGGRPFQRAGRSDLVRVIEGTRTAAIRFAPRLDFARLATRMSPVDSGIRVDAAIDPIVLVSPGVKWTVLDDGHHQSAVATVDPSAGPIVLELRYGVGSARPATVPESQRRTGTERFWTGWAGSLVPPRTARDATIRSAVVLKALVQAPTGAIAAAATTSLPEQLGGERNWDYRFCWPRDAALAAASLVRMGNTGVAMKLLDWLGEVVDRCESPERLRPIYTVAGTELPPEGQVRELEGYEQSRPVRLGNAASAQVQLDVFGPIVDLIAMVAERGAPVTPQIWRLVEQMVQAVHARWHEPDHGIWEFRSRPRHHVYSKTMCWQAVDRAIRVAEYVQERVPSGWGELRDAIREDVLAKGFSRAHGKAGAFVCAYDLPEPDASVLTAGLSGMVAHDDPRLASTVDWVLERLGTKRGVHRYLFDDGLAGVEGAFHLCTGWAVRALCAMGKFDRARDYFQMILDARGPTGLLSEEAEVSSGAPLGNYPQAYSHLALIDAAFAMDGSG
jgi:trehalose 6-phosphate phosphatase